MDVQRLARASFVGIEEKTESLVPKDYWHVRMLVADNQTSNIEEKSRN